MLKSANQYSAEVIKDMIGSLISQSESSKASLDKEFEDCSKNLRSWEKYEEAVDNVEKRRKKIESELFDLDDSVPSQEVLDSVNALQQLADEEDILQDLRNATAELCNSISDNKARRRLADTEDKLNKNMAGVSAQVRDLKGNQISSWIWLFLIFYFTNLVS